MRLLFWEQNSLKRTLGFFLDLQWLLKRCSPVLNHCSPPSKLLSAIGSFQVTDMLGAHKKSCGLPSWKRENQTLKTLASVCEVLRFLNVTVPVMTGVFYLNYCVVPGRVLYLQYHWSSLCSCSFKIPSKAPFWRKARYLWNCIRKSILLFAQERTCKMKLLEMHLLTVIGKLNPGQYLYWKNPQAFRSWGFPNCSVRAGNCDPHSLVTFVAAEGK